MNPVGFKAYVIQRLRVIEASQVTIINLLRTAATQETRMKADLTDVLKAVEEQATVDASIEALVDGLAAKLDALASQGTVDPADLTALAKAIRDNNDAVQAKVTANTTGPAGGPPTGNPPPPPPPAGV